MPFIPNYDDAAFPQQSEPDSVDFEIILAAIKGNGVISGCAVSAQGTPGLSVAVASGTIVYAGATVPVAGGNVSISGGHGTYGRVDLVWAKNDGTIGKEEGNPSNAVVLPTIPANAVALAAVYVPASDTAINTNQIIDKRVFVGSLGGKTDPFVFNSYGIR